ncbi:hypothetical protein [Bradyrhizobium mercantei]|uniref:hypothetical protein n=1 Tax=Bradyrhizobium mercantei TaxID=1904807 RepID=UPI0011779E73|nr:hypothetical protein [Bradyrhizobium mercantei]
MKRSLFITLMVFVAAVAVYQWAYPTYSYRYRLTIDIETDGKLHSGSSVVEVIWYAHLMPALVSFSSELRGQAALVDLGPRGVVVATLVANDWGEHNTNAGWGALWLVPRAFGVEDTIDGLPAVTRLRGKRKLGLNNLPRLLWFSNPQDPHTAKTILVDEIASVLGPSARFAGASVEMTSDPLVIDIRQKLPWVDLYPDTNRLYLPNNLAIGSYMFIGAAP